MPWLETAPVEQREHCIADYRLDLYTMTELCQRYNVSRKTGYKFLNRMEEGGRAALRDRSRAPHHSHIASRRWWPSRSARRGRLTRAGGRACCSSSWSGDTRTSTGRRRAPPATCWPAAAW